MRDTLRFEGSCTPNPGGRMAWSWRVIRADGGVTQGHGERAGDRGNTMNVAEYQGLLAGLHAYRAAGGRGSLLIVSTSQVIVNQVAGAWRSRGLLAELCRVAQQLIGALPGEVTLQWSPKDMPQVDAMPPHATPDSTVAERTFAPPGFLDPPLPRPLRLAIERLNAHPAPKFSDLARLRVGGTDAYSRLALAQARERAGMAAVRRVTQAFPDDIPQQVAALRWALRGLAVELAIRKAQVDAEIRMRTPMRRTG